MLLNDETRSIIVGKVISQHNPDEKVTYYKFELNENGVANVRIPTLRNETKFYVNVRGKKDYLTTIFLIFEWHFIYFR